MGDRRSFYRTTITKDRVEEEGTLSRDSRNESFALKSEFEVLIRREDTSLGLKSKVKWAKEGMKAPFPIVWQEIAKKRT